MFNQIEIAPVTMAGTQHRTTTEPNCPPLKHARIGSVDDLRTRACLRTANAPVDTPRVPSVSVQRYKERKFLWTGEEAFQGPFKGHRCFKEDLPAYVPHCFRIVTTQHEVSSGDSWSEDHAAHIGTAVCRSAGDMPENFASGPSKHSTRRSVVRSGRRTCDWERTDVWRQCGRPGESSGCGGTWSWHLLVFTLFFSRVARGWPSLRMGDVKDSQSIWRVYGVISLDGVGQWVGWGASRPCNLSGWIALAAGVGRRPALPLPLSVCVCVCVSLDTLPPFPLSLAGIHVAHV